ncbi:MAG: NAD-dependent DNA ligase LigA [Candidatus Paceibacterota bacterium]
MNKKEAKKRIKKLREVIRRHRYLYHVKDNPEISDEAFDRLKHELKELEEEFNLIAPDSPTQRVGGEPLDKFEEVEHEQPMLSIEDLFSREELEDWKDYLKRLSPSSEFNYFCELKIDGFAVSLIYEEGSFVTGATRGNGRVGENVTKNLKTIESIPLKVTLRGDVSEEVEKGIKDALSGRLEVRGEVYMNKEDFEELNEKRKKEGKEPYANPRNTAAGSIRQLDPKLAASRPLNFLAYNLVTDVGQEKHSQEHQILEALGFKVDAGQKCEDLDCVVDFWKDASEERKQLPFEVDGVVVSVNNNTLFNKLGVAGKSPRAIRALKFAPEEATTEIKDIKVQVGRTGAITPIAILEPVNVKGVTITRATLHNKEEMEELGVKIGDTVVVQRAGDVIPQVINVITDLRDGSEEEFVFPEKCPVCGTDLVKPEEETIWRCPNPDCRARRKEFLYHFVSREGFDIEGLGPKIIDQLLEQKLISNAPDIFQLEKGDLLPLEKFAEKAASNLIEAIEESREIPLFKFINALSIRYVGEQTSMDLAQYFRSVDKIKKASQEELEKIPDIGPNMAKSIVKWFNKDRNVKLVKELKKQVEIIPPEEGSDELQDKTFVFTGSLSSMTRPEAKKRVKLNGGSASSSVSEKTDYLVRGENPGSKLNKAEELGVEIIQEQDFLKLINE